MACKRPGVRVPLAPHFSRSEACYDLGNALLSACNLASDSGLSSYSGLKPMQARRVLDCGDTAVLLPSLSDSQTDSQSVIRPAPAEQPSPRRRGAPLRLVNLDDL